LKGRERMGSSLPPVELARWDSTLFEKLKCISSIALVGRLEKSREKHSPDAGPEAPDAVPVRPVCRLPGSARVRHQTPGTRHRLERPVSTRFALRPGFKFNEHRTVRRSASGALHFLRTSMSLRPMCTGESGANKKGTFALRV